MTSDETTVMTESLKGFGRRGALALALLMRAGGAAAVLAQQPEPAAPAAQAGGARAAARPTWCCPTSVTVDVGGYNGRIAADDRPGACRSLGIALRPGHPEPAEEPAGAPVDARDLGADLRDLQDLPDHAGQVHRHPRDLHRRRHRAVLRRAVRAWRRCASSSSCSSASSASSAATAWPGSASA